MAGNIQLVANAIRSIRSRLTANERAVAKLTKQAEASPIATGFDGGISIMSALANQQDIVVATIIEPVEGPAGGTCNGRIMRSDNADGSWDDPSVGRLCGVAEPAGGTLFVGAMVIAFLHGIHHVYGDSGGHANYFPIAGDHLGWPAWIDAPPVGDNLDRYPWYAVSDRPGGLQRLTHESPGMTHALCVSSHAWDPLITTRHVLYPVVDGPVPIFVRLAPGALVGCWFNGATDPVCQPECPTE